MIRRKRWILCLLLIVLLAACSQNITEVSKIREATQEEILIFEEDLAQFLEYKKDIYREKFRNRDLIITAVGDIMLGRGVGPRLNKNGMNLAYKNLKNEFDKAHILFGNLEHPISDRGSKLPGKGICLRAEPKMVNVLNEAGFDVVSLANNHILDYDSEALLDTFDILDKNKIGYIGAGKNIEEARKPYVINTQGKTIGFLGYDEFYHYYYSTSYKRRFMATESVPGTAPLKEEQIIEDIKKAKKNIDILAISLHWGIEESNNIANGQRELAHRLIDNGADIILGHHPHVIQPIEIYKGRPIIYSMGNYIFDQNDENNKQAIVVSILIKNGDFQRVEALPIYIKDKQEPIIAKGSKGDTINNKLINLSRGVDTIGEVKEDRVIFYIQ